ncbi:MAG TPA: hypothetical protein VFI91_04545 [Longimicrobiaceae bacterium]|nr:hypothetical protein [Longimicrobiaceae bacterium]
MRVLYALICEDAQVRQDGRLDVHGIFHQLFAPGFPAKQDQMVLAVAIEWDDDEEGRYDFRFDLVDPNSSPAITINGHTDVSRASAGEAPPQTRLILPLEDVVFPQAGTYLFELHLGEYRSVIAPIHLTENPDAA